MRCSDAWDEGRRKAIQGALSGGRRPLSGGAGREIPLESGGAPGPEQVLNRGSAWPNREVCAEAISCRQSRIKAVKATNARPIPPLPNPSMLSQLHPVALRPGGRRKDNAVSPNSWRSRIFRLHRIKPGHRRPIRLRPGVRPTRGRLRPLRMRDRREDPRPWRGGLPRWPSIPRGRSPAPLRLPPSTEAVLLAEIRP